MNLAAVEREALSLSELLDAPVSGRLKLKFIHRFLRPLIEQDRRGRMQSYFLEFFAPFIVLFQEDGISHHDPSFLISLNDLLDHYGTCYAGDVDVAALQRAMHHCATALLQAHLIVGQEEECVRWLGKALNAPVHSAFRFTETDPLDRLRELAVHMRSRNEKAHALLLSILEAWQGAFDGARSDRIYLALVERSDHGAFSDEAAGCLMPVQLKIRQRNRDADSDLCRIVNGAPHSMNPHISALQTLSGRVKQFAPASEKNLEISRPFDLEFLLSRPEQALEGRSWEAPTALLALAGMVNVRSGFTRRRLPQDFIVTGAVSARGHLKTVDEKGLREKIRTVFFSPLRRLAVPWQNFKSAVAILEALRQHYPERHLILESVEDLPRLFQNANMMTLAPWNAWRRLRFQLRRLPASVRNGAVAGAVLVMLVFLIIRPLFYDRQPVSAELAGRQLVVRNLKRDVLWSHEFPFVPQVHFKTEELHIELVNKQKSLRVQDLDGDGFNDVLLGTCMGAQPEYSGRVFCFGHDGTLRWDYRAQGFMTFGSDRLGDYYRNLGIWVVHPFREEKPCIILQNTIKTLFPSSVTLLNARGQVLGEYWNSGRLHDIICIDLDGDGVQEILAGGENNETRGGILAVLDPRNLKGASPQDTTGAYFARDAGPGSQLAYLRFPHTPLYFGKQSDVVAVIRGFVGRFEVALANTILLEKREPPYVCIIANYIFDSELNLLGMELTDPFMDYYFLNHGTFPPDSVVQAMKRVQYWDGRRFTEKPAWSR